MFWLFACAPTPPVAPRWGGPEEVAVALEIVLTPHYVLGDTLQLYGVRAEVSAPCTVTEGDVVVIEGPCARGNSTWIGRATYALDEGGTGSVTLDGWGRQGRDAMHLHFLALDDDSLVTLDGTFLVDGWAAGRGETVWEANLDGDLDVAMSAAFQTCVAEPEPEPVSAEWTLSAYDAWSLGVVHESRIEGEVATSTVGAYTFSQKSEKERCDYAPEESRIEVADGDDTIEAEQGGCNYDWDWSTGDGRSGTLCR